MCATVVCGYVRALVCVCLRVRVCACVRVCVLALMRALMCVLAYVNIIWIVLRRMSLGAGIDMSSNISELKLILNT